MKTSWPWDTIFWSILLWYAQLIEIEYLRVLTNLGNVQPFLISIPLSIIVFLPSSQDSCDINAKSFVTVPMTLKICWFLKFNFSPFFFSLLFKLYVFHCSMSSSRGLSSLFLILLLNSWRIFISVNFQFYNFQFFVLELSALNFSISLLRRSIFFHLCLKWLKFSLKHFWWWLFKYPF